MLQIVTSVRQRIGLPRANPAFGCPLLLWLTLLGAGVIHGKSYRVDGIVVAVDTATRTLLVSHRPVGKYMPAMMMPFRVESGVELRGLHAGVRIEFELVVHGKSTIARNIRRLAVADVAIPAPREQLKIGDAVPDFDLTDQHGRQVRLSGLLGKVVAINFIYTRCPLPDVCPRLAANFAVLQRRFRGQFGRDLMLLSITVDPDFDTPPVLAEYAKRWSADYAGWRFLTGDVAKVAAGFGEVYWADEGSIGHNSTTSVIGRDGRLAAIVEGSSYRVDQLRDLIALQLGEVSK